MIGDISNLETRHLVALDDQKITEDNLKWYSDLKEELEKNGLSVDDISHLAKVVNGIRQYGFNTEQVLNEFSNLELLKAQCQGYQCSIARLKNQYDTLNRDFSFLQQRVSSYNQSLSKYNELEAMGFGLKGLKLLWHTIREIAVANDIPLDDAIQKFLKDIDLQYDDKLGFESKVDKLQVEVNRLNQEYNRLCAELSVFPCIGPTLLGLLQAGVKEKDIMNIASFSLYIKIKSRYFYHFLEGISNQNTCEEAATDRGCKGAEILNGHFVLDNQLSNVNTKVGPSYVIFISQVFWIMQNIVPSTN